MLNHKWLRKHGFNSAALSILLVQAPTVDAFMEW